MVCRAGRERAGADPYAASKCVNAVDKGVRREIDGKATNKGVRGELKVDSLKFKAGAANAGMYGGMGRRSRRLAGACMLLFFLAARWRLRRGELRGVMSRRFHRWQP